MERRSGPKTKAPGSAVAGGTALGQIAPWLFLVTWSSGAVAVKFGLLSGSVWSFLSVRAFGSFAGILIFLIILNAFKGEKKIQWREGFSVRVLLTGLLLQVVYQAAYFLAISRGLSLGLLAIVLGCQPLVVPLLAREPLTAPRFALLALALIGLALAVSGSRRIEGASVMGLVYALLALAGIAVGTVLQSRARGHLLSEMLVQYGVGSVVYACVLAVVGWKATFDLRFILSVSWMILAVSIGATLLLFYMLAHDLASRVSTLFFLVPILAMSADHWVFGAAVSGWTIMGSLVVVVSMMLYRRTCA